MNESICIHNFVYIAYRCVKHSLKVYKCDIIEIGHIHISTLLHYVELALNTYKRIQYGQMLRIMHVYDTETCLRDDIKCLNKL